MDSARTDAAQLLSMASRAMSRFSGHRHVLEAMALRLPLPEVLTRLVQTLEEASPGTLGSVLLVDSTAEHVFTAAAPSLPPTFSNAIDGQPTGPQAGSCGTAVYRREPVIVADIAGDPLWQDYAAVARENGLGACWSTPIFDREQRVLGTFAQYSREPRAPTDDELRVLDDARDLASVAIQMTRAEEALRQAETQLQFSQKMDAVARLAGGIAHDFSNLLTVIGGNITLAMPFVPSDSFSFDAMLEARDSCMRASALARQLLSFSRREPVMPELLDLQKEVREVAGTLQRVLGGHITLQLDAQDSACAVKMDRSHLEQALLTLAMNARDAMPDGGTVSIITRTLELAGAMARPGGPSGPVVTLAVHDTGKGMDENTRARAFEPFFSTRTAGRGIGLGLPTVYAIVTRHGGAVQIDSAPSEGTTVTITLPAAERHVESAPSGAHAAIRSSAGTILLVEDEDAVRRLARRVLMSRGYDVIEARDGVDALTAFRANHDTIDAVVTDVMMPRMGGPTLVEQLRSLRPSLPVLFCSGYTDVLEFDPELSGPHTAFLPKPYSAQSLTEKLQSIRA